MQVGNTSTNALSTHLTNMKLFDSFVDQHLALFTASFETNPLDGKCDQRATVSSQPVKVIYNAVSKSLKGEKRVES